MKKFFAVLIVFILLYNAGFGIFLCPLLYTLTPLQRYYLRPYLASSWQEQNPAATTKVQLIWKVRPETGTKKAKPKTYSTLATEDDLLPVPARELLWKGDLLPFRITRKAELDGWSGIEQGPNIEVNSAKLAPLLQQEFFAGEPVWRFFVQPVLVLAAALSSWMLLHFWRTARRKHYLWKKPVPLWGELGQKLLTAWTAISKTFVVRHSQPTAEKAMPRRVMEPKQTAPKLSSQMPAPRASPRKSAAVQNSLPLGDPPSPNGKPKEGYLWDESQEIE